MLSRTAEDLYWMARNMERAENTARMLEVSFRLALLPTSLDREEQFEPKDLRVPDYDMYGYYIEEKDRNWRYGVDKIMTAFEAMLGRSTATPESGQRFPMAGRHPARGV